MRILVVRLGAMGDVIHALPAVATLKHSFPDAWIAWALESKWASLLDGNPNVDRIVTFDRKNFSSVVAAWRTFHSLRLDCAVDLQGLIKSALVARCSGARRRVGYPASQARESMAAWLYTEKHAASARHIVDRHLDLVRGMGCERITRGFDIPRGVAEGELPERFVLASPYAGWRAKEWPMEYYTKLAALIRLPLVLNGHPGAEADLRKAPGVLVHISSVAGLIDATRRATAVVGVDSGPLHLGAALSKPGVAIFGPTDPARNGPCGGSIRVLRASGATTTYQRSREYSPAMLAITPEQVAEALQLS